MDLKTNKKRKSSMDVSSMIYGKMPPQSKEIEQAVLGAVMLVRDALDVACEILRPECFYVDAHQKIFAACMDLSLKGQPIDIMTVVEKLKFKEQLDLVGGPYYITEVTKAVVSSANIETHCRIILQKFIAREMIRISGETMTDAYEDSTDVFDLLDDHERKFTEITTGHLKGTYSRLDAELMKRTARIQELRRLDQHITGVPSGFSALDRITHGWQNTDLIILAARPSVGKTAFALRLARHASKNSTKSVAVGFFSMEMSKGQLTDRLMSAESGIWIEKITNGMLDDEEMSRLSRTGINPLSNINLFIDDTPALNIFELRSRARSMKRKDNVGLIIVDYLQLMSGMNDRQNREQEISTISRNLKGLAKQLQVPIIALSQLNRATETRKGGEKGQPVLSDLRESGAIEQDADTVIFMYRPEYYDQNTNEMGESTSGETNIRIAKHRNGALGKLKLRAQLSIQNFYDWDGVEEVKDSLGPGSWKPITTAQPDLFIEGKRGFPDDTPF